MQFEGAKWINMHQDLVQWQTAVKPVMIIRISQIVRNSFTSLRTILCSRKKVNCSKLARRKHLNALRSVLSHRLTGSFQRLSFPDRSPWSQISPCYLRPTVFRNTQFLEQHVLIFCHSWRLAQ
jgi:hypothetical protein